MLGNDIIFGLGACVLVCLAAWVLGCLGMALVGDADISRTAALAFLAPCSFLLFRKSKNQKKTKKFFFLGLFLADHAATIFTATASNQHFDKG